MVKFWLYSSASLVACAGLLWYTYMTRMQFYPAVIYLVTSKISVLILGNAGLVLTILFAKFIKSIFLGSLRDAEVEILHENVRYAITETCLALTIFRDEINFQVVVLFTSLIFLKVFHWLSQSRIEYIEQTDVVTRVTHVRLVALMSILAAVDMAFVIICGMRVMEMGASVFILFGFEFLILLVTLIAIFLRYILYVIDARMDGNWNNKFTYLFYLELVSEICKLVIYLVFFMLIFTYYGMPLHIVRDLWMSIKNLQRRIASYFRYRKITANLNERFPNPTDEELQGTDRTCIICREEMTAAACKKLPCSHIFHIDCLKMWVQRQQTCPTCRSTIPTGGRPPVVPQEPGVNQQVDPNAPPAPPANAAVPGNQPAAGPPPGPTPAAAAAPQAAQPPHQPNPAAPAPPIHPAGHHATPPAVQAPHPTHPHSHISAFAPGYPPPFMSPMMFGPAMGAPFGYGYPPGFGTMPPFGFHGAQPGSSPGQVDPAAIQRQIEMLHVQLAALQAATQAYGQVPFISQPPGPLSTSTPPTLVPAPAPASATPTPARTDTEDLEEKAPIPQEAVPEAPVRQEPVEQEIPRVLTEAERRREELRNRYARIYASNRSESSDNGEERKSDE